MPSSSSRSTPAPGRLLSLRRLRQLPYLVHVILLGTLLSRFAFFMVWPYLGLMLYRQFALSATDSGLILALSSGFSTLVGIYGGNLADRYGRGRVMLTGSLLGIIGMTLFACAGSPLGFALGAICNGMMRSLLENQGRAMIADHCPDALDRELALQLRYYLINLGGAIGPLCGLWLGLAGAQSTFWLAALGYLLYGSLLAATLWQIAEQRHQTLSPLGFGATLAVLARDRAFKWLTCGNILTMFIYAHFQSTLDLYLMRLGLPGIAALITQLLLINTLTIVLLQLPLVHALGRFSPAQRIRIGTLLFGAAQIGFWLTPISWPNGYLLAAFVLSVGEVILFPALNLRVDELAPAHLRGTYVGAASLYLMGSAAAPIIGGLVIDHIGGQWLFISCLLLAAAAWLLYHHSERIPQPAPNHAAQCQPES